jgi:hypothetical protein
MRVHPVFNAEKLQKDSNNPLFRQANSKLLLLELQDGDTEYEVVKILAVNLIYTKLKYRIQWKDWDPDPKWYLASVLSNSLLAL